VTKARHNLYLPHALSDEIDRLAKKPGVTKSAIVEGILHDHFARQNGARADEDIRIRLSKLEARSVRLERLQLLQIETIANFIRFHFSTVPPIATAEQAGAKALAEQRFAAFIDQVARRRASGKSLLESLTREALS
jgi:hypothetical protein